MIVNLLKYLLIIVAIVIAKSIAFSQSSAVLVEEFIFEKAPFKECHASTIVETNDGLIVAWFAGTHEKHKDVEIWISRKINEKWEEPVSVANGIVEDKRYPCWNPVLFNIPGGDLLLFYKIGPSPSKWWGMLKRSTDQGLTWSEPEQLPEGILGPIKNKPVLLSDGILLSPSSTEHNSWKVHMERSDAMATKWEPLIPVDSLTTYNVIQPAILNHKDNKLQILCRSKEGVIVSSFSDENGKNWDIFKPTILPNPNSGIDAVSLRSGKHLLVYNHTTVPKGKWGGKRYPLNIASTEDGYNWNAALVLEDQKGEYSYPAIIQSDDGLAHIIYTWDRLRIKHVVIDPELLEEKDIEIWNFE